MFSYLLGRNLGSFQGKIESQSYIKYSDPNTSRQQEEQRKSWNKELKLVKKLK